MKSKIQMYLQSIAVVLVLTMLFSLIFAILYYFNLISTKTFHIWNWITGLLAYICGGMYLGNTVEKKALLNAFLIVCILAIPAMILSQHDMMGWIQCASKLITYMIGCVLMFAKRKPTSSSL